MLVDVREFSRKLRDILHPASYRSGASMDAEPFTLLLWHMNWVALGRYALAVLPWEAVREKPDVLRTARRAIMKHFVTIPCFFQVGLYLIIAGPSSEWSPVASNVEADSTGFHSVILQAIHFLDLDTGDDAVKRSQWGPIRFGGTVAVTDAVDTAMDRRGRGDFRLRI
jgi:hypothetical protein